MPESCDGRRPRTPGGDGFVDSLLGPQETRSLLPAEQEIDKPNLADARRGLRNERFLALSWEIGTLLSSPARKAQVRGLGAV